jgi:adhesin transport system outer membrane protein
MDRKIGAEAWAKRPALAMIASVSVLFLLAGCVGGSGVASRLNNDPNAPAASAQAGANSKTAEGGSALITELQARRSVLPLGGAFAKVATSVLEADAGTAAAELRIARLKSEARAKNWLPKIGPAVSLTSLNGLAAGLLLEQALFDFGRRKAERAYAAADVEVAAVTLSAEINQRIYEGLAHYVAAERARAQGVIAAEAESRLAGFADIMRQRVEGGISDRSEERVIQQHLAEMQATLSADRESETSAMAELAAMSAGTLSDVRGIDKLAVVGLKTEPLSVVKARGEGKRSVAEAQAAKAGLLPGITAVADMSGGGLNPGVKLGGSGLLGMGTKAEMQALDATQDVVDRRSAEAAETAERRIVALERQIASLHSRQSQGDEVLRQTNGNLEMFVEQYKVGRRSLLELVGQYDSFARLERDQVALRYEIAILELEIARDRGLLVDGARM